MSKVVVIGAGASGIMAAIKASENNEVILLEGNNKIGKKILLTGNGKCNYWNNDININNYHTDDINNLNNILNNKDEVLAFLDSLGIYPKIKNGYYYPNSNQASSICEILCKELVKNNVNIVYGCKVNEIEKSNDKFIIHSNLDDITCDKVILATGSKAYPKTGSDGSSYEILKKYHTINTVTPSLVPMVGNGDFFKEWANLRVDAKVSLCVNGKVLDIELGEIQLTDYGISGIPVFNLSGLASKNLKLDNKVNVKIDFLPEIEFFDKWVENRNRDNKTVEELFESVLPYQLVFTLLKIANINRNDYYNNLTDESKKRLAQVINNFDLEIIDTLSFDRSQVCTGGISLLEINPRNMESTKVKDLYLVGELLDVDGKCGGFNLAFAFITGYLAGRGIK